MTASDVVFTPISAIETSAITGPTTAAAGGSLDWTYGVTNRSPFPLAQASEARVLFPNWVGPAPYSVATGPVTGHDGNVMLDAGETWTRTFTSPVNVDGSYLEVSNAYRIDTSVGLTFSDGPQNSHAVSVAADEVTQRGPTDPTSTTGPPEAPGGLPETGAGTTIAGIASSLIAAGVAMVAVATSRRRSRPTADANR